MHNLNKFLKHSTEQWQVEEDTYNNDTIYTKFKSRKNNLSCILCCIHTE